MNITFLIAMLTVAVFSSCESPKPTKPFFRPEPDKISVWFYTEFDISQVDSIGIVELVGARENSNEVVNHKIMSKDYDENKQLWRFDVDVMDSLRVGIGHLFQLQHDSLYQQYHLTAIEPGKHATYTENQPDAYYWEIRTYKMDGKLFEDPDIYLTSEKVFRDLHSWQVK